MNWIFNSLLFCSVILSRVFRSTLSTCAIAGLHVKRHWSTSIRKLWTEKAFAFVVIGVAGPDIQLLLQLSLVFIGVVGGMTLAYTVGARHLRRRKAVVAVTVAAVVSEPWLPTLKKGV
jgi:hypothetical protein